jgi:ABC-2 type transport system ATP-binding protein
VIRARNLTRDYGATKALRSVSLDVSAGETVALVGPNGAGKSTLLGILAGVLAPTGGSAEVAGVKIPGALEALGRHVGYVPQGESTYPELTVTENLRFFGHVHGLRGEALRAATARLLRDVGLTGRAGHRAGDLSGGLRQRLAIASSLLHDPHALLLDEPGTGLDPASRDRLGALLRAKGREGRAVLFSTHHLEDAARHADRVVLLVGGAVKADLPAAEAPRLADFLRASGADA